MNTLLNTDKSARAYKNPYNYAFNCDCGKNFSSKKNFNAHQNKVHNQGTTLSNARKKKCALCSFECEKKNEIERHFEITHDIKINLNKLSFTSKEEFLSWKSKVEGETVSSYIKIYRPSEFKDHITTYYVCSRSGFFHPSGKGIRHEKIQGSRKINAYCPANIKLKYDKKDGSCSVLYTETHIGHKNELKHLSLTRTEREKIAIKISMKVPFTDILNEIRDSIYESNIQRIHLVTRKDLYNIETSFNLTSNAVRHKDDAISVDAWVNEMQSEDNCVLYYKPQGVNRDEIPEFKSEDFILIIMTAAQLDILKTYGNDCVCLDGTHGLNSYDFELNTLLVLDDLREGFPCAFLISNRSDTQVLRLFFAQIKLKSGVIQPKVFMSDLADTFFNAWIAEMGTPEKRLYCTWHIDRAWRKNLSKIKTKENQVIIYTHLRTLLTERDKSAFQKMLSEFCNMTDPDSLEFIEYFKQYYVKNCESWAYCFRLHAGINTNMHLERMHRSIKYIYLKGKNVKRLDKAIAAILTFVRDKLFNKVIAINKGKLCGKITNIRSRHLNMKKMDANNIIESELGWEIVSEKGFEMYVVQKKDTNCDNCQLICTDCGGICIHQFQCSCPDSAIKFNMCKHIHLVAMSTRSQECEKIQLQPDDIDQLLIVEEENKTEVILQELSKSKTEECLEKQKEELDKLFHDTVKNLTTQGQVNLMKRVHVSLKPTLTAIETANNTEGHALQPKLNTNAKNIVPQRKFFSTKKKNKKKIGQVSIYKILT